MNVHHPQGPHPQADHGVDNGHHAAQGQAYRGWDVHSYSAEIGSIATEIANVGSECGVAQGVDAVTWSECIATCREIVEAKTPVGSPHRVTAAVAVAKMERSYSPMLGGFTDPDAGNINVAALLVMATRLCRAVGGEGEAMLTETLSEIGGTCLQGQSHRLAWLVVCLKRSIA